MPDVYLSDLDLTINAPEGATDDDVRQWAAQNRKQLLTTSPVLQAKRRALRAAGEHPALTGAPLQGPFQSDVQTARAAQALGISPMAARTQGIHTAVTGQQAVQATQEDAEQAQIPYLQRQLGVGPGSADPVRERLRRQQEEVALGPKPDWMRRAQQAHLAALQQKYPAYADVVGAVAGPALGFTPQQYAQSLQEGTGYTGGLARGVSEGLSKETLATIAAAPFVGPALGVEGLLGKLFLAQGAVGAGQHLSNLDLLRRDPGAYAGEATVPLAFAGAGAAGELYARSPGVQQARYLERTRGLPISGTLTDAEPTLPHDATIRGLLPPAPTEPPLPRPGPMPQQGPPLPPLALPPAPRGFTAGPGGVEPGLSRPPTVYGQETIPVPGDVRPGFRTPEQEALLQRQLFEPLFEPPLPDLTGAPGRRPPPMGRPAGFIPRSSMLAPQTPFLRQPMGFPETGGAPGEPPGVPSVFEELNARGEGYRQEQARQAKEAADQAERERAAEVMQRLQEQAVGRTVALRQQGVDLGKPTLPQRGITPPGGGEPGGGVAPVETAPTSPSAPPVSFETPAPPPSAPEDVVAGSTRHAQVQNAHDTLDLLRGAFESGQKPGSNLMRRNYEAAREATGQVGVVMPPLPKTGLGAFAHNAMETAQQELNNRFRITEPPSAEPPAQVTPEPPTPVPPTPVPPAPVAPRPELPPREFAPGLIGKEETTFTPANTPVRFRWAVVPADELVTSHNVGGGVNPDYDPALQPRDRSRVASFAQVSQIATQLQPERLAGSATTAEGAPVTGPDVMVESGNGRALAVRHAYDNALPGAEEYRRYLVEHAADFGLDRNAVEAMKNPTLVRVRQGELAPAERAGLAEEMGRPTVSRMSAPETARGDARRLTDSGLLDMYDAEKGIHSQANLPFVRGYMDSVPEAERGDMQMDDGSLSTQGAQRIRRGILGAAYGDADLLQKLIENPDNNIKNVGNALEAAAPEMAKLRRGVEQGNLYPLDITPEVAEAAKRLSYLRDRGVPVEKHLEQLSVFDDTFGPEAQELLRLFETYKSKSKSITQLLSNYADTVTSLGDPNQTELFSGKAIPTKGEVLKAARTYLERNEAKNENATGGLDFAGDAAGAGANPPGGGEGAGAPPGGVPPGAGARGTAAAAADTTAGAAAEAGASTEASAGSAAARAAGRSAESGAPPVSGSVPAAAAVETAGTEAGAAAGAAARTTEGTPEAQNLSTPTSYGTFKRGDTTIEVTSENAGQWRKEYDNIVRGLGVKAATIGDRFATEAARRSNASAIRGTMRMADELAGVLNRAGYKNLPTFNREALNRLVSEHLGQEGTAPSEGTPEGKVAGPLSFEDAFAAERARLYGEFMKERNPGAGASEIARLVAEADHTLKGALPARLMKEIAPGKPLSEGALSGLETLLGPEGMKSLSEQFPERFPPGYRPRNIVEFGSGVTPKQALESARAIAEQLKAARARFGATKELRDQLLGRFGHFYYGDTSQTRREFPVSEAAILRHDTNQKEVDLLAHLVIPKVTEGLSAREKAAFQTAHIGDAMIAERARLTGEIAKGEKRALDLKEQARVLRNARGRAETKTRRDIAAGVGVRKANAPLRELDAQIEELSKAGRAHAAGMRAMQRDKENIALERKGPDGNYRDPLSYQFEGKKRILTENAIRDFMERPNVVEANRLHKELVEPELEKSYRAAGGKTLGLRGTHGDLWLPKVAAEATPDIEGGEEALPVSTPGTVPGRPEIARAAGSEQFTGQAGDYLKDYDEAVTGRLRKNYSRATRRAMYQQMLDDGALHPTTVQQPKLDEAGNPVTDGNGDPVTETVPNNAFVRKVAVKDEMGHARPQWQVKNKRGEWEEARVFPLQGRAKFQYGKGVIDPTLPTTVATPNRVWNHLRPLLSDNAPDALDRWASNHVGKMINLFVGGIADSILHGSAQGSRAARAMSLDQQTGLRSDVANAAMIGRSVAQEFLALSRPLAGAKGPVGAAARGALGALGKRFPGARVFTPAERLEALRFGSRVGALPPEFPVSSPGLLKTGSRFLHGENGLIANAITAIYDHYKSNGALETQAGRMMTRDALRMLNTHGRTQGSTLGKALRGVGLGTFWQTGVKNRAVSYQLGPRAYVAGLVGSLVLHSALFKLGDDKHRWPWEVAGARPDDVPLPIHDSDGTQVRVSTGFLDRPEAYAEAWIRELMQAKSSKQGALQAGVNLGGEVANQALLQPGFSGPGASFGEQLFGLFPNVRAGERILPPSITTETPTARLNYSNPQRLLSLLESANPLARAFGESVTGEGYNLPKSPWLRGANLAGSIFGLPQMRPAAPEQKVLSAVQRRERAHERAQKKR